MADTLWQTKAKIIREYLDTSPKVVIDLGCHYGELLSMVKRENDSAIGIDSDLEALTKVPKGIETFCFDLNRFDGHMFSEKADIVLCLELIEHLIFPQNVLKVAYRILKPNGLFFLSTPIFDFGKKVYALFNWEHFFKYDGEHIRFYTEKEIRRLIKTTEFKILKVMRLGRIFPFNKDILFICQK